ncbi:hypothetical protein HPP92_019646 [Vanilla planifolia]|uniref:Uncharacterized protein n=1 Tax=Vanilla planifolia TaxID=51239 RepID=A0A835Q635_VANPL|nr:hypothetical protein HPP92_019646 [Vanilla planifolia]
MQKSCFTRHLAIASGEFDTYLQQRLYNPVNYVCENSTACGCKERFRSARFCNSDCSENSLGTRFWQSPPYSSKNFRPATVTAGEDTQGHQEEAEVSKIVGTAN